MVSRFRRRPADPSPPAVPDGQRVYAIGDVHGRADLLDRLLVEIAHDEVRRGPAATLIVLLGDLVDRGPDSAAVVERAAALAACGRARAIMGNHEEMLLAALDGDPRALRLLLRNGGVATLESYGLPFAELEALGSAEAAVAALAARVPPAHHDFLARMEDSIAVGDYLFVHAGIRPGVPIDRQRGADLRWIREPFLADGRDHGAVIVHGHSIADEPELHPNRLGIDTGAYRTGRLTALGLQGTERWVLGT